MSAFADITLVDAQDPVLRTPAVTLGILPPDLDARIAALRALMHERRGVGIAAPQVGWPIRLALVDAPDDIERVLINPRITADNNEHIAEWEGCLSLPGREVLVERATRVHVQYTDERGRQQRVELAGIAARVAAHEIDHLDGILITDRGTIQREEGHESHA